MRDEDMPPPCDMCPRGGPQNEDKFTLSPRNMRAYELYHKLKATSGAYRLHPKIANCTTFAEVMWIVERSIEAGQNAYQNRMARESAAKRD